MKPIGPLMREHRLIERMLNILAKQMKLAAETRKLDTQLIAAAVDFFRTYADRTHHSKEEDILFRELAKKPLSANDSQIMRELIEEHILVRKMVTVLLEANKHYLQGNPESLNDIMNLIKDLVNFYPLHITKEDKSFFYPCLEYLTKQE